MAAALAVAGAVTAATGRVTERGLNDKIDERLTTAGRTAPAAGAAAVCPAGAGDEAAEPNDEKAAAAGERAPFDPRETKFASLMPASSRLCGLSLCLALLLPFEA
jgi:hypothetical protein